MLALNRADSSGDSQLVNVGVEYTVHEANARRLIRVLVRELDMDLPYATFERCYRYTVNTDPYSAVCYDDSLSDGPLNLT